jgi:subtilisin-like proprotein convertase family protein
MKQLLLFFFALVFSMGSFSQNNYWKKTQDDFSSKRKILEKTPSHYEVYKLDTKILQSKLKKASKQFSKAEAISITLPDDNDNMKNYLVYQSGTISEGLAKKFPELKSYRIFSKEGSEQGSLVVSKWGVFIEIFRTSKSPLLIQPIDAVSENYIIYKKKDLEDKGFECLFDESQSLEPALNDNFIEAKISDNVLRRYRYAVGTTGEYSQYHIQRAINAGIIDNNATEQEKKNVVLAAVVTTVDRLNTVYERDLGIQLSLVSQEPNVIFLDPDTDPYDNSDIMSMLNNNTSVLNQHIGVNNYDGGHLFTTYPGGGISGLGVICNDNYKARSVTGSDNPIGDPYDIDFVAHEVGHSFGANHTFANSCSSNRNLNTSIEPGSGSTIMAYAGICAPNVQNASDAYFHIVSIKEIGNFVAFNGNCSQNIDIGNTAPAISVTNYQNKYIPKSTPFMLTVSAVDNEGDFLTYNWEEVDPVSDNNITNYTPNSTNTSGPMFRSYWATSRPTRFFPRVSDIVNNSYGNQWEVLPEVSRFMTFNVTVRDNHPGGGQTPYSSIALQVDDGVGPFRVTSQGNDEVWLPGETKTITWNVAGTTGGDVDCATVDILLSTDYGHTFDHILAENVPNDGSETITVPSNLVASSAYLMVKGHDRYFFDLAKGKISLGEFETVCSNYSVSPNLSIPDNDPTGVSSTLQVNDDISIEDINVSVNISHTYIRDLKLVLTSPQGTEVVLYDRNCNNQHNIIATFDDDGSAISCSNLSGHVIPVGVLNNIAGESSQGTWTLWVSDNQGADVGVINSWGLEICTLENTSAIEGTTIEGLNIWPNPAKDSFNISFEVQSDNTPVEIKLFDISGRKVLQRNYNQVSNTFFSTIQTQGLTKGMYLLYINDGRNTTTQKLLIE